MGCTAGASRSLRSITDAQQSVCMKNQLLKRLGPESCACQLLLQKYCYTSDKICTSVSLQSLLLISLPSQNAFPFPSPTLFFQRNLICLVLAEMKSCFLRKLKTTTNDSGMEMCGARTRSQRRKICCCYQVESSGRNISVILQILKKLRYSVLPADQIGMFGF